MDETQKTKAQLYLRGVEGDYYITDKDGRTVHLTDNGYDARPSLDSYEFSGEIPEPRKIMFSSVSFNNLFNQIQASIDGRDTGVVGCFVKGARRELAEIVK